MNNQVRENKLKSYFGLWKSNSREWLLVLDKVLSSEEVGKLPIHCGVWYGYGVWYGGQVLKMPGVLLKNHIFGFHGSQGPYTPKGFYSVFGDSMILINVIKYGNGREVYVHLNTASF